MYGIMSKDSSEVQSQLYIAFDEKYISDKEFRDTYQQAAQTRATIHGFIKYLSKYKQTN